MYRRVGLGLHWPAEASDAEYKGSSSSYGGLVEEQTTEPAASSAQGEALDSIYLPFLLPITS